MEGLAQAANLQRLNLQANRVSNLTGLAGLNNLQYLYLRNNLVTNLSPLLGQLVIDDFDAGYSEQTPDWRGGANSGAYRGRYTESCMALTGPRPGGNVSVLEPHQRFALRSAGDVAGAGQPQLSGELHRRGRAAGGAERRHLDADGTDVEPAIQSVPRALRSVVGRGKASAITSTTDTARTIAVMITNGSSGCAWRPTRCGWCAWNWESLQPLAPANNLELADVRGNPLNNRSHDGIIPGLSPSFADNGATTFVAEGLFYEADLAPIFHNTLPSTGGRRGGAGGETVSLANLAE